MSAEPDFTINHYPRETCPDCGKVHDKSSMEMVSKRQVVDIPLVKATITEHLVFDQNAPVGIHAKVHFLPISLLLCSMATISRPWSRT
jgi:hypothetical protein